MLDRSFLTANPLFTGARIVSILICRFILSLRRFDIGPNTEASSSGPQARWLHATSSGLQRQLRGNTGSTPSCVVMFGAQQSDTLPAFIAPFQHPVHVDDLELEAEMDRDWEASARGQLASV